MDITKLKEEGLMVLPNVLEKTLLDNLKEEFNSTIEHPEKTLQIDYRFVQIKQPLYNCIHTIPLAFHSIVTEIADNYFAEFAKIQHKSGIGTCNLRRSHIYNGPQQPDTTMYHCDANRPDPYLLKFFIYLNDVQDLDSGPFMYAKGSHINKPSNCRSPYRKSDTEIENMYKEKLIPVFGNYGDLIVACTFGFHKGLKVVSKPRTMFTINYVDAPENDIFHISKQNSDSLSIEQQPYSRFLKIV